MSTLHVVAACVLCTIIFILFCGLFVTLWVHHKVTKKPKVVLPAPVKEKTSSEKAIDKIFDGITAENYVINKGHAHTRRTMDQYSRYAGDKHVPLEVHAQMISSNVDLVFLVPSINTLIFLDDRPNKNKDEDVCGLMYIIDGCERDIPLKNLVPSRYHQALIEKMHRAKYGAHAIELEKAMRSGPVEQNFKW